jgi:hypothetical protein
LALPKRRPTAPFAERTVRVSSRDFSDNPQGGNVKPFLVVLLCGLTAASCQKRGTSTDTSTTGGGGTPTSPTTTGDPATADWTSLASQLAQIGAEQIVAAMGSAGPTSVSPTRPRALTAPAQNFSVTGAYFCCGPKSTTTSHIVVSTSVTVPPGAGALGILQTIGSFNETEWTSTTANGWRIDLSQLQITAGLTTTGSTITGAQQLRLSGSMAYGKAGEATMTLVAVDVLFTYANLESSVPTASGQMGPATLAGQSLTPSPGASRCSRPREGCGPLVNGDAPCTVWPKCPV